VEILVYSAPSLFTYVTFLVHVVLAMDLIVLMPLTKFAHAVYRPLALFLDEAYRRSREEASAREAASSREAA